MTEDAERAADGIPLLDLEVTSILSQRTRQGLVALKVGSGEAQLSAPKARQVAGMLFEAAEAADSDALFWAWCRGMDLPDEAALAALRQFRGLRSTRDEQARAEGADYERGYQDGYWKGRQRAGGAG